MYFVFWGVRSRGGAGAFADFLSNKYGSCVVALFILYTMITLDIVHCLVFILYAA
jgi:hypothetical protein